VGSLGIATSLLARMFPPLPAKVTAQATAVVPAPIPLELLFSKLLAEISDPADSQPEGDEKEHSANSDSATGSTPYVATQVLPEMRIVPADHLEDRVEGPEKEVQRNSLLPEPNGAHSNVDWRPQVEAAYPVSATLPNSATEAVASPVGRKGDGKPGADRLLWPKETLPQRAASSTSTPEPVPPPVPQTEAESGIAEGTPTPHNIAIPKEDEKPATFPTRGIAKENPAEENVFATPAAQQATAVESAADQDVPKWAATPVHQVPHESTERRERERRHSERPEARPARESAVPTSVPEALAPRTSPAKATAWRPPVVRGVPCQEAALPESPGESACDTTLKTSVTVKPEPAKIAFVAELIPLTQPVHDVAANEIERPTLPVHDAPPPLENATSPAASHAIPPAGHTVAVEVRPRTPQSQPHADEPIAQPNRSEIHVQAVMAPHNETPSTPARTIEEPAPVMEPSRVDTAPEPPKAGTPAREIRIELAGGEKRVEVKLSDRGGEVRVAVRTPDVHLAERLRDNLPALSSRLTESGFRTETWHPGPATSIDRRQTAESGAASSGNESAPQDRHGGEDQQRDDGSRRQRSDEENQQPKEKRRDLEWQTHWTASAAHP
jgi:hypothetical protein